MEGRPGADFVAQVIDDTALPPKEIRELLGEVTDPRYSIYNAMTTYLLLQEQQLIYLV